MATKTATAKTSEACESCDEATGSYRVTVANQDGEVLDQQWLCADCLPEQFQVGVRS